MYIFENLTKFEKLFWILKYSSENGNYLTVGQRICINQERAILMQDDYDESHHNYEQPKEITVKIKFIEAKIKNSNWTPEL